MGDTMEETNVDTVESQDIETSQEPETNSATSGDSSAPTNSGLDDWLAGKETVQEPEGSEDTSGDDEDSGDTDSTEDDKNSGQQDTDSDDTDDSASDDTETPADGSTDDSETDDTDESDGSDDKPDGDTDSEDKDNKLYANKFKSIEDLEKSYTEMKKMYDQRIGLLDDPEALRKRLFELDPSSAGVNLQSETDLDTGSDSSTDDDIFGDSAYVENYNKDKTNNKLKSELISLRKEIAQLKQGVSPVIQKQQEADYNKMLEKYRQDKKNYPGFADLEPAMVEYVNENPGLLNAFNSQDQLIRTVYNNVRLNNIDSNSETKKAINKAVEEAKKKVEKEYQDKLNKKIDELVKNGKVSKSPSKKKGGKPSKKKGQNDPLTNYLKG